LDKIEWLKKGNNAKEINEEMKIMNAHKKKISRVIEVYNAMLQASTMILNAHKVVTFKMGDMVHKIIDDMDGKIQLAKKEVDKNL
jgi:predicted nuclease with RNAse H fold